MKITPKLLWSVLAGLGILWLIINPGSRKIVRYEINRRKILAEIKRLKIENEKLESEINLLETDKAYYGRVVCRELGMLRPGEVEYRILEEKGKK